MAISIELERIFIETTLAIRQFACPEWLGLLQSLSGSPASVWSDHAASRLSITRVNSRLSAQYFLTHDKKSLTSVYPQGRQPVITIAANFWS